MVLSGVSEKYFYDGWEVAPEIISPLQYVYLLCLYSDFTVARSE